MTIDPHPWASALDTLYEQVWHRLIRGVHDRHAPSRHPTLATVSPQGMPNVRTVVLRGADKTAGRLEIHTNLRSAKVIDIQARPVAALHVWDSGQKLQIRIRTDVDVITGTQAAAKWAMVPQGSRTAYSAQVPGAPISGALDYDRQPDPEAFMVLSLRVASMDILHLGPDHRRAVYFRENNWSGQWVAP